MLGSATVVSPSGQEGSGILPQLSVSVGCVGWQEGVAQDSGSTKVLDVQSKGQDNNARYLLHEDLSDGRTGPLPGTHQYYSASQCFCLFRAEL